MFSSAGDKHASPAWVLQSADTVVALLFVRARDLFMETIFAPVCLVQPIRRFNHEFGAHFGQAVQFYAFCNGWSQSLNNPPTLLCATCFLRHISHNFFVCECFAPRNQKPKPLDALDPTLLGSPRPYPTGHIYTLSRIWGMSILKPYHGTPVSFRQRDSAQNKWIQMYLAFLIGFYILW